MGETIILHQKCDMNGNIFRTPSHPSFIAVAAGPLRKGLRFFKQKSTREAADYVVQHFFPLITNASCNSTFFFPIEQNASCSSTS